MEVLKSFVQRVSYFYRFFPTLKKHLKPYHKLLKKKYHPDEARSIRAFNKVKDMLISPLTLNFPVNGLPLTFHLNSTNKFIGTLLA